MLSHPLPSVHTLSLVLDMINLFTPLLCCVCSHPNVSFQSSQLQANMEHLKNEWEEFLKEQQRLKEVVDEEHAKAVGQLSIKYSEKKKDLTKFSPI